MEFFFCASRQPQGRPTADAKRQQQQVQGGLAPSSRKTAHRHRAEPVIDATSKMEVRISKRKVHAAKLVGHDTATRPRAPEGRNRAAPDASAVRRLREVCGSGVGHGDRQPARLRQDRHGRRSSLGQGTVGPERGSGRRLLRENRSIPTPPSIWAFGQTSLRSNVGGEVIGINTAMSRPAENIGFAVLGNTLKQILPQLREKGKVTRLPGNTHRQRQFRPRRRLQPQGRGRRLRRCPVGPGEAHRRRPASSGRHDRQGGRRDREGHARPDRDVADKASAEVSARRRPRRQGRHADRHAGRAQDNIAGKGDREKVASDGWASGSASTSRSSAPRCGRCSASKADVDGASSCVLRIFAAADAGIQKATSSTGQREKVGTTRSSAGSSRRPEGDYLKLYVFNPRADVPRVALVKIGNCDRPAWWTLERPLRLALLWWHIGGNPGFVEQQVGDATAGSVVTMRPRCDTLRRRL